MSSIDINMSESSYPQGHTFRHRYNGYNDKRYSMWCQRQWNDNGYVPITEVDYLLSARDIYTLKYFHSYVMYGLNLNKHNRFNDFVEACEEFATEKKVVYNSKTGLDEHEYVAPIIDYLNFNKIPHCENIYDPDPCPKKNFVKLNQQNYTKKNKKRSWKYYEMKKAAAVNVQYVIINGNRYNSNYIYKSSATGYIPIVMHPNQEIEYDDDESVLRSKKKQVSKTSISVTFHNDSAVNGIILTPEPMKFEYIQGDNSCGSRGRRGRRNPSNIRVLVNNPNYIEKFELYYRSSNTDGQWVKHGIYDGNTSIFNSTKIKFDEIVAKELRLIPISHTGSFEKVVVGALTHIEKRYDELEDDSVTYTIFLPHGKYRHMHSIESDRFSHNTYHSRNLKGEHKEHCREFAAQCKDF